MMDAQDPNNRRTGTAAHANAADQGTVEAQQWLDHTSENVEKEMEREEKATRGTVPLTKDPVINVAA